MARLRGVMEAEQSGALGGRSGVLSRRRGWGNPLPPQRWMQKVGSMKRLRGVMGHIHPEPLAVEAEGRVGSVDEVAHYPLSGGSRRRSHR